MPLDLKNLQRRKFRDQRMGLSQNNEAASFYLCPQFKNKSGLIVRTKELFFYLNFYVFNGELVRLLYYNEKEKAVDVYHKLLIMEGGLFWIRNLYFYIP